MTKESLLSIAGKAQVAQLALKQLDLAGAGVSVVAIYGLDELLAEIEDTAWDEVLARYPEATAR
jgi:hypothetical protein